MATMTVSLPDPMKDWIEEQVRSGDYASSSDYVRDLVRKDRAQRLQQEVSLQDLQRIIDEARAGPVSRKSVAEILAEARALAEKEGPVRD